MADKDPNSKKNTPKSGKEDTDKTVLRPKKTILRPKNNSSNDEDNAQQHTVGDNANHDFKTVIQPRRVTRGRAKGGNTHATSSKTSRTTGTAWADSVSQDSSEKQVGPGTVLKDRFELLEILGHGGMGTVYKAIDRRDIEAQHSSFLAIKVLNDEFKNDKDLLRALHGEARKTQQLAHPNIVTVFDFDRDGGIVFMTMEYMDGIPLDEFIKNRPNGVGVETALLMVNQMANALNYAHSQHIIHSDFKPGNVFVGQNHSIRVLDFGIARVAKGEQKHSDFDAGILGGLTPAYASLEMFNDEDPAPSDDLYALACVTYELLTGRHPFNRRGADVAKKEALEPDKIKSLNARQWKALSKGLAFQRKDRFSNIQAFIEGLNASKSKLPIYLGSVGFGLIAVGFLAKDPILEFLKQVEFEGEIEGLEADINQGNINKMLKALALVEVLSESNAYRLETEEKISDEILRHITLDGYGFVSKFILHFEALNQKLRRKILFQGQDGLLSFYEKEMGNILSNPNKKHVFNSVESLLNNAENFYPDSFKLRRLQNKKNDLILDLDNRFSEALKQKRMLLDPNRDDIVDVLTELIKINPNHPLVSSEIAEMAYVREATVALENKQLDLAKQLITQGMLFFSSNASLADLLDQVKTLEQIKDKQNAIYRLEKQITNLIEVFKADIYSWLQQARGVFNQMMVLQADNKLILDVKVHTGKLLENEVKLLTEERKWEKALSLVVDVQSMITERVFVENKQKINRLKEEFEQKVKSLFHKIKALVSKNQTDKTIKEINGYFSVLETLSPGHALIQLRKEQIALSFLQIAEDLRSKEQWDRAFEYLEYSKRVNTDQSFQVRVQALSVEMNRVKLNFENMEKEELALAKIKAGELRDKRRQEKVTHEIERFNALISTMTATEENALAAKLILDSISAIDAKNPIIKTGFLKIENVFVNEVGRLINEQKWVNAKSTITNGRVFFPKSERLKASAIEIENTMKLLAQKDQQLKIKQQKDSFEQLLENPLIEKNWQSKVNIGINSLSKLLANNDTWLIKKKSQLISIYFNQAEKLLIDKRMSNAKEVLKLGLKIDNKADNLISALKRIEKQELLVKESNRKKELIAKIAGLKQSFEIQLKANKVKRALSTLNRLKKIKGVDKNYTNNVSSKLIANAYYRLANIQDEKGNISGAKAFIKKGLAYNKVHEKLNRLRLKLKRLDQAAKRVKEAAAIKAGTIDKDSSQKTDKSTIDPAKPTTLIEKKGIKTPKKVDKPKVGANPKISQNTTVKEGKACLAKYAGYGKRSKARCYDYVSNSVKGPILAVIPAGGGASTFAIGINEVSIKEYNFYCELSGKCSRHSLTNQPITKISLQQAKGYVQWLSKVTGYDYRLPTKQQWLHASKAGGRKPVTDYNCKLVSSGTVIKGQELVSAKSGKKNAWGLRNYIGNAQEWVVNGSSVFAMGGGHTDFMTVCNVDLQRPHSGGADKITGFRVVRNIN